MFLQLPERCEVKNCRNCQTQDKLVYGIAIGLHIIRCSCVLPLIGIGRTLEKAIADFNRTVERDNEPNPTR